MGKGKSVWISGACPAGIWAVIYRKGECVSVEHGVGLGLHLKERGHVLEEIVHHFVP